MMTTLVQWSGCGGCATSMLYNASALAPLGADVPGTIHRLKMSMEPAGAGVAGAMGVELRAVRALAEQLQLAVNATPPPTAAEMDRARRYASRLRVHRQHARLRPKELPSAHVPGIRSDIGMSASQMTSARARMCRRRIVHQIGSGVMGGLSNTMSTHFFGGIGGALVNMMVKPIGAVFSVLLLALFTCFIAMGFIDKMGTWQDKILPVALAMMMPPLVVSYVAQALAQSMSHALSDAIYVELLRKLDQSLMSLITVTLTTSAAPMLHHKILHSTVGGIMRDTTRVLSLRLAQIISHSVTHTVTHSIIHHYYCIYCYFYAEFCNYCYCARPPGPPILPATTRTARRFLC